MNKSVLIGVTAIMLIFSAVKAYKTEPVAVPAHLKFASERFNAFQKIKDSKVYRQNLSESNGLVYDTAKWAGLIDETWGSGISTEKKLSIFDKYWDTVNINYSCFVNLKPINWDSLGKSIRNELAQGVSKGKFAGIMCMLTGILNDGHTALYDRDIRWLPPTWGYPAIIEDSKYQFPACLTVEGDSAVVVYHAPDGNVFNLKPGDIILGYNHKSVEFLTGQVMRHRLPNYTLFGSTYTATHHRLLTNVAASWFLFDTVNILKTDGSLENYPVSLMEGQEIWNNCYEMIPPEGIKYPNINSIYQGDMIRSTVLDGLSTGYVALFSCLDFSGDSLYKHVKYLIEEKKVRALIIDIRTNFGGTILAFDKTLKYLKKGNTLNWLGCATRADEKDRLAMSMNPYTIQGYNIYDDDESCFAGPVALLVGPNAVSAGDILPVCFSHLKTLKSFGKPTAGAFGSINSVELVGGDTYMGVYQSGNFYEPSKPGILLSHLEYPVDEMVWFTSEGLAMGKDDVMEAAKAWIYSLNSDVVQANDSCPITMSYTNSGIVLKSLQDEIDADNIEIYNMGGVRLTDRVYINFAGNSIDIDFGSLAPGVYILTYRQGHKWYYSKIMVYR